MMERRVALVGAGAVHALGNNAEEIWQSLVAGKSGVGAVTKFDTEKYSCKIASEVKNLDPLLYLDPKEAKRFDPFLIFAIAASDMALADSGLDLDKEDHDRIGVIIGSGVGGLEAIEAQKEILMAKGPRRVSPFFIPMLIVNMGSGQVSIRHQLCGPNSAAVTACATGTHSIGDAFKIIQRGAADIMLAGGSEAAITPLGFAGFCAMHAMSTSNDDPQAASRPFDMGRDGFVMGEGSGVVVLEEMERARKRGANIYAEVVGYGMTGDGYHITQPAPDGAGARKAMKAAVDDAGLNLDEVDYINAHGTSTPLNDKFESIAIRDLFGEDGPWVSSTKSMTGHLLGAAGGIECVIAAKAIQNGVLPPTINLTTPDPECDLRHVANETMETKVRVAMSNSLGFGGHNAVLALKAVE